MTTFAGFGPAKGFFGLLTDLNPLNIPFATPHPRIIEEPYITMGLLNTYTPHEVNDAEMRVGVGADLRLECFDPLPCSS